MIIIPQNIQIVGQLAHSTTFIVEKHFKQVVGQVSDGFQPMQKSFMWINKALNGNEDQLNFPFCS